jgi:hypothetical protein
MSRKKKLKFIQLSLLTLSILMIFFAYFNKFSPEEKNIISKQEQQNIENKISNESDQDIFFKISYSGLDFSGNRYIINAEEARNDKDVVENIFLKQIDATFYMKNNTTLKVFSNEGIYNNKTLDMTFEKNVKAFYEGSELFSEKAKFLNSESYLTISGNVIVNDAKGTLSADQLLFDIEKQNLSIVSFDKKKVNANVTLK